MKKTAMLFLAMATALSLASAAPEADRNSVSRHFDFQNFTILSVSHSFRVDLTFADTFSVDVEVPDFIEPYLRVSQVGEKVVISLENLPWEVQRKLNDNPGKLQAKVSMKQLRQLQMSGATKLVASNQLNCGTDELRIELSGASELEALSVRGEGRLLIDLSGASEADVDSRMKDVKADLSGASKLTWKGDVRTLDIDCSGASKVQFDGNVEDKLTAEVSGSSKLNMGKNIRTMKLEVSGASKFELSGQVEEANVELTGASKALIPVTRKMLYDISGVSTLRVKDLGATIRGDISRGSKLEYVK